MTRTLLRISFLLFVLGTVGLIGVNQGLNPGGVSRIQAHAVSIELSGTGPAGSLAFGGTASCNTEVFVPGGVCVALVSVQNTGEGVLTISAPAIQATGSLATCGRGGWLSATAQNLSYTPNLTLLDGGDIETFNVVMALHADTPNECQGGSASLAVSIRADCNPGADPECTDEEPETPGSGGPGGDEDTTGGDPAISGPLIAEVLAQQLLAQQQAQAGAGEAGTGLISEVAGVQTGPTRLPVTGSGGVPAVSSELATLVRYLMIGSAAAAVALFLLTLGLHARGRRGGAE